jgi:hypothetical protein
MGVCDFMCCASMAGALLTEYRIRDDPLQNPDGTKSRLTPPG